MVKSHLLQSKPWLTIQPSTQGDLEREWCGTIKGTGLISKKSFGLFTKGYKRSEIKQNFYNIHLFLFRSVNHHFGFRLPTTNNYFFERTWMLDSECRRHRGRLKQKNWLWKRMWPVFHEKPLMSFHPKTAVSKVSWDSRRWHANFNLYVRSFAAVRTRLEANDNIDNIVLQRVDSSGGEW